MANSIKQLTLLGVLILAMSSSMCKELPANFNSLPDDIQVEILTQHINNMLEGAPKEYSTDDVYIRMSEGELYHELEKLAQVDPKIRNLIGSDKFKNKFEQLLKSKKLNYKGFETTLTKIQAVGEKETADYWFQGKIRHEKAEEGGYVPVGRKYQEPVDDYPAYIEN